MSADVHLSASKDRVRRMEPARVSTTADWSRVSAERADTGNTRACTQSVPTFMVKLFAIVV